MKLLKLGKRLVVVGALGFIAAALVVPGAIAAQNTAYGDLIDPAAPRPINTLPSVVRGSLPVSGVGGQANYLATLLYSYGRSPAFWQAAAAIEAGTATSTQLTMVQQTNGTWKVPATRTASLTKVVGGVGSVITGWSAGVTIGAGTLDLARELGIISFDPDGTTCAALGDVVAGLFGADCTGYNTIPEGFPANSDAVAGPTQMQFTWTRNGSASVVTLTVDWTLFLATTSGCSGDGLPERYHPYGIPQWNGLGTQPLSTEMNKRLSWTVTEPGGDSSSWPLDFTGTSSNGGYPAIPCSFFNSRFNEGLPALMSFTPSTYTNWTLQQPGQTTVPLGTSDPERQLQCIIVASGQTFSALSEIFREGDGVLPAPVCPQVPGGLTLESTEIRELNLEDGTWLTLWSESTTPEFQAAGTLAPECAGGTCMLDLRKEDVSCFQQPASCAGWMADPNRDSTYNCWYGTHAVDLAECFVYAPAFEPGATTTGNTYGDPTTGTTLGAPAGSSPGSDAGAFGTVVQNPAETRQCFPTGWAVLNPVEWVMKPVQCALEWAFVPRPAAVEAVGTRVSTAWAETSVAQAPTITASWIAALPEEVGGCQGPMIDFGPVLDPLGVDAGAPSYPLSACEEPMATMALISNIVSAGMVTILGAFAVVRNLAAAIGYVGPGKDGSAG